jgi:hypothetical protein
MRMFVDISACCRGACGQVNREILMEELNRRFQAGQDISLAAGRSGQFSDDPSHPARQFHGQALFLIPAAARAGQDAYTGAKGRGNAAHTRESAITTVSLFSGAGKNLPDVFIGDIFCAVVFDGCHESASGYVGMLAAQHGQARKTHGQLGNLHGISFPAGHYHLFNDPHGIVVMAGIADKMAGRAGDMTAFAAAAVTADNIPGRVMILQGLTADHAVLGLPLCIYNSNRLICCRNRFAFKKFSKEP